MRVDIANGDEKLAAYLKNLFDSCSNIQALVLENANSLPLDQDPSFLTDFLGAISVREFHCEKNIEVAVSFPQNVEKCSISLATLAQMYRRHVNQQPPMEDGSSFLGGSLPLGCFLRAHTAAPAASSRQGEGGAGSR